MRLLSSSGLMSRFGHGGGSSLLARSDRYLSKELKSIRTGEIALSSFGFGMIQGKYKNQGGLTLVLPIDLMAGAAFHALSLFSSKYSHHFHAIGDGALASFFTTSGYRVGERWGAGGSLMHSLSDMFGDVGKEPAGGSTIADKELANLVQAGT